MNTKDTLTSILVIAIIFFAGWFANQYFTKPIERTINLTQSEAKKIIQDARLGWISPDSAQTLLAVKQDTKIKWIDSTSWNFKDSTILNVKDSLIVHYIPIYEADTTLTTTVSNGKDSCEINQTLKQRFFPRQRKFASELKTNSVRFNTFQESDTWVKHITLSIGVGGIGNGKMLGLGGFIGVAYSFNLFK